MTFDLQAFANRVVSQFVYGQNSAPTSLTPEQAEELIARRANAERGQVSINDTDFMSVVGRYATIGQSKLTKGFFNTNLSHLLGGAASVTLSKTQLIEELTRLTGSSDFTLNQVQWEWGQGAADYLLRVFIFNSTRFQINDDAEFVIYADGRKEIHNVRVEPRRELSGSYSSDNFDFESDSGPAFLTNPSSSRILDPFGLGRTVDINIRETGDLSARNQTVYTFEDYRQDILFPQGGPGSLGGAATRWLAGADEMFQSFYDADAVRYTYEEFNYFFGSLEANEIAVGADWDHLRFQSAAPPRARVIGGEGADVLDGSLYDDEVFGGDDDDVLSGYGGQDTIEGGDGADEIYGGLGDDTLIIDEDDTVISGGFGYDTADLRDFSSSVTWLEITGDSDSELSARIGAEVSSIEKIVGTAFADTFTLKTNENPLVPDGNLDIDGGDGDDTIVGNDSENKFWGGDGDDTIEGGSDNDILYGGAGDDVILGGAESYTIRQDEDRIFGGAGNDRLIGGADDDKLYGEADDDLLFGGDGEDLVSGGRGDDLVSGGFKQATPSDFESFEDDDADQLFGGSGADTFIANNDDVVKDIEAGDTAVFLGSLLLKGGKRAEDTGAYKGVGGESYILDGDTLTVTKGNTTITIESFRNGDANIDLRTEKTNDDEARDQMSPIVIDLDGDGLELTSLANGGVFFDLDDDGSVERTSWVRPDDGLLVFDWNDNGLVDSGGELFRTRFSRADYMAGVIDPGDAYSAFNELYTFDSNGDGKISVGDLQYDGFKIWQDANGNGVTDAGELKTLSEAGIASIDVSYTRVNQDLGDGNTRFDRGRATRTDGRVVEASDIFFAVEGNDANGEVYNPDVAGLPFMVGQGRVVNLDAAMSDDPLLRDMVSELAALDASQISEYIPRVMDIVLRWTGGDQVGYDSRGGNVNGQWLHALEQLNGRRFAQGVFGNSNPLPNAGSIIAQRMNEYIGYVAASLFTQTSVGQTLFAGLSNVAAVEIEAAEGTTLQSLIASASANAPQDMSDAIGYWQLVIHTLETSAEALGRTTAQVRSAISGALPANIRELGYERIRSAIWTTELSATARGNGGFVTGFNPSSGANNGGGAEYSDNLYVIRSDTQRIEDGTGSERYVVSGQNIDVVIKDYLATYTSGDVSRQQDSIHFEQSLLADLTFSSVPIEQINLGGETVRTGYNLVIEDVSRNIRIVVENAVLSGSTTIGIETLVMADGQTYGLSDILSGLQGDIIFAEGNGATVNGTLGNNTFIGSATNDIFTFGPGSGSDRIVDKNSGDTDTLQIAANLADIRLSAPGGYNRRDLLIETGANDRILIQGQYVGSEPVVQNFVFADGQQLNARQITGLLMGATFGDDTLQGTVQEDEIDGLSGDDMLQGRDAKDTYVFRVGSGHDTIIDRGQNRLVMEGLSFADIEVQLSGLNRQDIRISLDGNDSITLSEAASKYSRAPVVTEFAFDDGVYTLNDILGLIDEPGSIITGTELSDELVGTSGNDIFDGLASADIFDDLFGNDSYRFGYGSGHDIVHDGAGNDTVLLTVGIRLEELEFALDSSGAQIVYLGLNDSLTFNGGVENLRSEDGAINISISAAATNRLIFDDAQGNAIIDPGDGTDLVVSGTGNHEIRLNAGFGTKIIYDTGGYDKIAFGPGINQNDIAFTRAGHDLVLTLTTDGSKLIWRHYFEAGTPDYFEGEGEGYEGGTSSSQNTVLEAISFVGSASLFRSDIDAMFFAASSDDQVITRTFSLEGGTGNDLLLGDGGDNVYRFATGDGDDVVRDYGNLASDGFGGGELGRFGAQSDSGDGNGFGYDEVRFEDGIGAYSFTSGGDYGEDIVICHVQTGDSVTIDREHRRWDGQMSGDIETFVFQNQSYTAEQIYALLVKATPYDDVIQAISPSVTIDALEGNDLIEAGSSGARVVFSRFDGADVLRFANGAEARAGVFSISGWGDLTTSRFEAVFSGRSIDLKITSQDGTSSLLIEGGVSMRFADGTVGSTVGQLDDHGFEGYTIADLLAGVHGLAVGTDNNDVITGTPDADIIVASTGNDSIFTRGVISGSGIDRVLFARGDGHDVVSVDGGQDSAGVIRIELSSDILRSDVIFAATSDGYLELVVDGGLDTLRVRPRMALSQAESGYDVVFGFDDGASAAMADIVDGLAQGTSGNDILLSDERAHVLDGGAGDDLIIGNGGDDVYRFGRGYGVDTIRSFTAGENNVVEFGPNIVDTDLTFEYGGQNNLDLVISIIGTNDRLVIEGFFQSSDSGASASSIPVSSFLFDGSAALSWQEFASRTRGINRSGNDVVEGSPHGSELSGGAGDDELRGGTGNDLYRLERGFGSDTIIDRGGEADAVRFGANINPANAIFSRQLSNPNDLLIEIDGLERLTLRIKDQFNGEDNRIEFFEFEDGTVYTWQEVQEIILQNAISSSDDVILGYDSDDIIDARGGDDLLIGGRGNDVLIGGDGEDVAQYVGYQWDYDITQDGDDWIIAPNVFAPESLRQQGIDRLVSIERVRFSSWGDYVLGSADEDWSVGALDFVIDEDQRLTFTLEDIMAHIDNPNNARLTVRVSEYSSFGGRIWQQADGSYLLEPSRDFETGMSGPDRIEVLVSDGFRYDYLQVGLTINAVNDAPEAVTDNVTGLEDLLIEGFVNAWDADGDTLTFAIAQGPAHGEVTLDSQTGTYSYLGNPDYDGADHFVVTVSDGNGGTRDITIDLEIGALNDAPVANLASVALSSPEDTALDIALPANLFGDVDGDALNFAAASVDGSPLPSWLSFADGRFTGLPPANFNGSIALLVTASDGQATTSSLIDLVISPVNDAPVGENDIGFVTNEDTPLEISVATLLANDGDIDGDALTVTAIEQSIGGVAVLDGNVVRFTPAANFYGEASFTYVVSDGQSGSSTALATLQVLAVNDPPIIMTEIADLAVDEDNAIDMLIPADAFVDVDGQTLTLAAQLSNGNPLPSWLQFDGVRLMGQPPANFNGELAVTVTATDGLATAAQQVLLTINAINDAPMLASALPDVQSSEDAVVDVLLPTGSFSDVDGDALSYTATLSDGSALPSWLILDSAGRFTGTPPTNFNGAIDIRVTASDGALSASDTFRLEITPLNDAPVVLSLLADIAVNEDAFIDFVLPSNSFADIDGDALALSATLENAAALPSWLSFDAASRRFTGTPPANFNGFVDARVTASDGTLSASDVFRLTVAPVNDAPVVASTLADQVAVEDSVIDFTVPAGSFADVDGTALSYTATLGNGAALPVWLSFDAMTQRFTGTPPADFNGALDVLVTASDGELSVSDAFRLTIDPVNDAPVLVAALTDRSLGEDTAIDFTIPAGSFTDVDGTTLTMSASLASGAALPTWLSFDAVTGRFTGTPPSNFNGFLDVQVTASDGSLSVSDAFRFAVNPVNDAPVAVDDGIYVTTSNNPITIDRASLLANDSDVDGDILSITSVGNAVGGTVVINSVGDIVFTPASGFSGNASFQYTLSDGTLSAQANAAVRVDAADPFATWRQGTDGIDILLGDLFETNRIYGRAGHDLITGGLYADQLAGGDGNDILTGLSGNDEFWGGNGNDILLGGGGTDTAYYYGLRASYSLITQGGILKLRVADNQPNVDGDDGSDQLSSIERLSFSGGDTVNVSSPIILDLDGNGVRTVSAADSNARYDLDGDGLADDTSWIGNTEGFLFLDRDGNGTVSNAGEFSFIDDAEGARSDLEGLRAFDSNRDGILSSLDTRFSEFRVWQDKDGDGAAESGEILTLTSAGVRSITLTGTAVDGTTNFGDVAVINRGSYTRTNGTTMGFVDAALTYFSAASNLPEIAVQSLSYTRKADKYTISYSGGALTLNPKSKKGEIDPRAGALAASSLLSFKNKTIGLLSPIILDLDGDGVEMRSIKKSKAAFDMNGDGVADDTGWAGKDDGFLVIDRNNDGRITHASELSFAAEDSDARSDLEALAALDNNGDSVLNSDDVRFGELKVWQDANGNGVTDSGELKSLAELGITEISLRAQNREGSAGVGDNILLGTSSFTRANGSTGTVGNAVLAYRPGTGVPATSLGNRSVDSLLPFDLPSENSVSGEVDALVAALRNGRSSGTGTLGGQLPANVDTFDFYSQPFDTDVAGSLDSSIVTIKLGGSTQPLPPVMDALSKDWGITSTDTESTAINGNLTPVMDALSKDWNGRDTASIAEIEAHSAESGSEMVAPAKADRLLALMRQDMATFGARTGEQNLVRREGVNRPVEFFA